jgi:hypothetical protein
VDGTLRIKLIDVESTSGEMFEEDSRDSTKVKSQCNISYVFILSYLIKAWHMQDFRQKITQTNLGIEVGLNYA